MEELDCLIRTLIYARSTKELELHEKKPSQINPIYLQGEINGLNIALKEIFKLIEQQEL